MTASEILNEFVFGMTEEDSEIWGRIEVRRVMDSNLHRAYMIRLAESLTAGADSRTMFTRERAKCVVSRSYYVAHRASITVGDTCEHGNRSSDFCSPCEQWRMG